jgi:hypothetical protein
VCPPPIFGTVPPILVIIGGTKGGTGGSTNLKSYSQDEFHVTKMMTPSKGHHKTLNF